MLANWGSRVLGRTSPWTLVAGGILLVMAVPRVRRGLRAAAVFTLAGAMTGRDNLRRPADDRSAPVTRPPIADEQARPSDIPPPVSSCDPEKMH